MALTLIQPKQKPFQRRKPALLPQATSSPETFNRFVVAKAQGLLERRDELAIANARWPADSRLRTVLRAAVEPPPDPPALAAIMTADMVRSLQPISAAAQLMDAGLLLHFDHFANIVIPDFIGLDDGPAPFVAPGQAAPVGELVGQGTTLEPRKLEFIVTVTREMILGSNAEKLIGDALRTKVAFGLDKALFDASPGDAARPPGLRSYNARLAESTSLNNATAAMMDVGRLVGAAEHIAAAAPFYFIARSRRISAMRLMMNRVPPNFVLLPSAAGQALPESVLLCVTPLAFASAVGLPEVELVESATVEMSDTPGSPDLAQAQRVRSLFQSDTLGLKVRIPASWALRHPAGANWITCLWPSDVGGGEGGLPEAPYDEFTYGRHQGAWEQICDEAPTTPPAQGWVRGSSGGSTTGWHLLADLTRHLAPLLSPELQGAPTTTQPPPEDSSDRIATTKFAKDIAGSGGGIPEAPPDGQHYARESFTWRPLEPIFLAKIGGQMNGPLITQPGTNNTNLGLSLGENSTGFWRSGQYMIAVTSGQTVWQASSIEIMLAVRLNAATMQITNVGDAVAAGDAMNQRASDIRYLRLAVGGTVLGPLKCVQRPILDEDVTNKIYVDGLRAPSLKVEPAALPLGVTAGTWLPYWTGNYPIPRGGNSRVLVSVAVAVNGSTASLWALGARCNGEVRGGQFIYFSGGAAQFEFYVDVTGNNPALEVELSISNGTVNNTDPPITAGDNRSQILIADLGPRPSAQEEPSEQAA